jgi:hypothetical protein
MVTQRLVHPFVVKREGARPVLFERIRKLDEEFDRMCEELARAFADMTEEQVEALVDEAP